MKSMKLITPYGLLVFILCTALHSVSAATWKVPENFATIQEAVDADVVVDGDTIIVGKGKHAGAMITKSLKIVGRRKAKIVGGPALGPYTVGFRFPIDGSGSGSTIKRFRFERVDLPVYAEGTHALVVKRNVFREPLQGVTNWGGSGWRIAFNRVQSLRVGNAGGIGIFIGDRNNVLAGVTGNLVMNNRVLGAVEVDPSSVGAFRGAGIALFASFSKGVSKAEFISGNLVSDNFVLLESTTPDLVDVVGIELSEAVETLPEANVFGNILVRNVVKKTQAYGWVPQDLFFDNEFFLNRPKAEAPVSVTPPSLKKSFALSKAMTAKSIGVLNPI